MKRIYITLLAMFSSFLMADAQCTIYVFCNEQGTFCNEQGKAGINQVTINRQGDKPINLASNIIIKTYNLPNVPPSNVYAATLRRLVYNTEGDTTFEILWRGTIADGSNKTQTGTSNLVLKSGETYYVDICMDNNNRLFLKQLSLKEAKKMAKQKNRMSLPEIIDGQIDEQLTEPEEDEPDGAESVPETLSKTHLIQEYKL